MNFLTNGIVRLAEKAYKVGLVRKGKTAFHAGLLMLPFIFASSTSSVTEMLTLDLIRINIDSWSETQGQVTEGKIITNGDKFIPRIYYTYTNDDGETCIGRRGFFLDQQFSNYDTAKDYLLSHLTFLRDYSEAKKGNDAPQDNDTPISIDISVRYHKFETGDQHSVIMEDEKPLSFPKDKLERNMKTQIGILFFVSTLAAVATHQSHRLLKSYIIYGWLPLNFLVLPASVAYFQYKAVKRVYYSLPDLPKQSYESF